MEEFDYVIVGAGSAGCVLADRLSASGDASVLLLEAGGGDASFWIHTPLGYGQTFFDPRVNWKFYSEAERALADRAIYFPRGKVVGGSSSINAMVYSHGMPSDYDDWRAAGNAGWGWDDVRPVYERFERRVRANGVVHGDGPLWVSERDGDYHRTGRYFFDAAQEIGLPRAADVNGPDPEGVGGYHITTKRGLRCSSAVAFLRPAQRRPNLALRSGAMAHRVLFEAKRARGVAYSIDGAVRTAYARREVILCAGAIGSPTLLQRSGVGPARLLAEHGIDTVRDLGAVGGGMQDHLGISYFYRATEQTLNGALGTWMGRLSIGLQFVLSRRGPLSVGVNQFGGMVRSSPDRDRPDIQLYFNPASYSTDCKDKRELLKPDRHPGFVVGFNSCRPSSEGRVDIASAAPEEAPRIRPNYLSTNHDLEEVVAGARLIGRLQESSSMRRLIDGAPVFDVARESDEAIIADFRARAGSVFHPCGTCRMAPEEHGGVVDPSLRVYGVERLRVVDASIFPNITSANINAPSMMVAHKAADMMTA